MEVVVSFDGSPASSFSRFNAAASLLSHPVAFELVDHPESEVAELDAADGSRTGQYRLGDSAGI
jgi:hypothetical protein